MAKCFNCGGEINEQFRPVEGEDICYSCWEEMIEQQIEEEKERLESEDEASSLRSDKDRRYTQPN
jgi:hypothetical protein